MEGRNGGGRGEGKGKGKREWEGEKGREREKGKRQGKKRRRRVKRQGEGERLLGRETCYKSPCFCIPPTNFLTNPITSTINTWPAWSKLNFFLYRKLSSGDAFFKMKS